MGCYCERYAYVLTLSVTRLIPCNVSTMTFLAVKCSCPLHCCCSPTDVCILRSGNSPHRPTAASHKLKRMCIHARLIWSVTVQSLDLVQFAVVMCMSGVTQRLLMPNLEIDNAAKLIVQSGATGSYDNWISLTLTWAWTEARVRDGSPARWLLRETYRGPSVRVNAH